MRHLRLGLMAATVVAATCFQTNTTTAGEIVVGLQCDRTGITQSIGMFLCPSYHDYIKLVNSKGGVGVTPSALRKSITDTKSSRAWKPIGA